MKIANTKHSKSTKGNIQNKQKQTLSIFCVSPVTHTLRE